MRQFANYYSWERQAATSDGAGTFTAIWTSPAMPTNAVWGVEATVVGVNTSGATQGCFHRLAAAAQSAAGVVAIIGASTAEVTIESAAAIDTRFTVDATARTISLEARDDAVSPMRFTAVVQLTEALTA